MPVPAFSATVPGVAAICQSSEQVWVSAASWSVKAAMTVTGRPTVPVAGAGAVMATVGGLWVPAGGGPSSGRPPALSGATGISLAEQAAVARATMSGMNVARMEPPMSA